MDSLYLLHDLYTNRKQSISLQLQQKALDAYNRFFKNTKTNELVKIINEYNSKKFDNYEKLQKLRAKLQSAVFKNQDKHLFEYAKELYETAEDGKYKLFLERCINLYKINEGFSEQKRLAIKAVGEKLNMPFQGEIQNESNLMEPTSNKPVLTELDIPLSGDEQFIHSEHIRKFFDVLNANVFIRKEQNKKFLHITVNDAYRKDIYEYLEKFVGIIQKVTNAITTDSVTTEPTNTEPSFPTTESNTFDSIQTESIILTEPLFSTNESNTVEQIQTGTLSYANESNTNELLIPATECMELFDTNTDKENSKTKRSAKRRKSKRFAKRRKSKRLTKIQKSKRLAEQHQVSNTDDQINTDEENSKSKRKHQDSNTDEDATESLFPTIELFELDIPLTRDEVKHKFTKNLMKFLVSKCNANVFIKNGIAVSFLHITANCVYRSYIEEHLEGFLNVRDHLETAQKIRDDYPLIQEISQLEDSSQLYQTYNSLLADESESHPEVLQVRKKMNVFHYLHCSDFTNENLNSINLFHDLYTFKSTFMSSNFEKEVDDAYRLIFYNIEITNEDSKLEPQAKKRKQQDYNTDESNTVDLTQNELIQIESHYSATETNTVESIQTESLSPVTESNIVSTTDNMEVFDLDILLSKDEEELISKEMKKLVERFNAIISIKNGLAVILLHITANKSYSKDIKDFLQKFFNIRDYSERQEIIKCDYPLIGEMIEEMSHYEDPLSLYQAYNSLLAEKPEDPEIKKKMSVFRYFHCKEFTNEKLKPDILANEKKRKHQDCSTDKSIIERKSERLPKKQKLQDCYTNEHKIETSTVDPIQTERLCPETGINTFELIQTEPLFPTIESNTAESIKIEPIFPAAELNNELIQIEPRFSAKESL
ncbi:uncharacterized protein LOC123294808 [Chrysoperla carnea]|uniref:uncharacterized protein LOC123294808 n=1 Tax=Chrysoperla carnea TaxID=189513 RepID=UPI001D06C062|nr:uncharacterized protein LOC123294808 [Chrysoperla carnea]